MIYYFCFFLVDLFVLILYGIVLLYKYINSKIPKITNSRSDKNTGKTVLFMVHGSGANEHQFIIAKYLLGNILIETINLKGNCNMQEYAEQVNLHIKILKIKSVILLGVSMGGLVCSYYTHFINHDVNIKGCITICTPFLGAPALEYLEYFTRLSHRQIQMKSESVFLNQLNKELLKTQYPYLTFGSKVDFQVPDEYSNPIIKNNHQHVTLNYPGHIALSIRPYVFDKVKEFYLIHQ